MGELELIGGVVFKRNSCGQPLSTPQLFERYAALEARVAELEEWGRAVCSGALVERARDLGLLDAPEREEEG